MITKERPDTARVMTGRERMLRSLRLETVDRPPVWFMRQAGRHLPGYRELRERHTFLDLCREPELCAQASCEPWREYGVDGVIVFNDILIPLRDMGMGLDFVPGPRFTSLIEDAAAVDRLATPVYGLETDVCRCLRAIRGVIGSEAALLGFVGAPFTVASFAVAGLSSQRQGGLDQIAQRKRGVLGAMQERLVPVLVSYAQAQVEAGADVIQVFESLAGDLAVPEYREIGLPYFEKVVGEIKAALPRTPVIAFGRGLWPFIPELAAAGADCLSLDHTRHLASARMLLSACGDTTAVQGNLSPEALLLPPEMAAEEARRLLKQWRTIVPLPGRGPTGWIFNLGHGVPEHADPRTVRAVAEAVRDFNFAAEPLRESGL